MSCTWWLAGLLILPLQVPRPFSGEEVSRELEASRRSIVEREEAGLKALADWLEQGSQAEAAKAVRARLPRPDAPDGPTRFVPLLDVVAARPSGRAAANDAAIKKILQQSAAEFFALAQRAAKATPPRYALAGQCLRAVLECEPDHAESRRLLGYVPYKGGWARPFAVQQFHQGFIDHPIFGWVHADWQPHLERGELPTPQSRGKVRWLPAAEADRLRANWNPPWQISTEHFQIKTNVPLAEAISFGRRLEAFHRLFMALMADVQADNSPVARRFRDPRLTGEPSTRLHFVNYYASKAEYLAVLTPKYGDSMERSLGFYDPPKSGTGRMPAYFFRDPDGDLPVTANLYHEVSHQLLFETAGTHHHDQNRGNYWVFEGLGTYFETVEPQPDGSLEVGGRVGRRMEEAIRALVERGQTIPLEQFIGYDEVSFTRDDPTIYLRYQQAMAMTVFMMQWHDGAYREGFLDYVRDAYRGRIRRGAGRSLEDRVGAPYTILEAQLVAFLKAGGDSHPQQKPAAAPKPGGAIRTVPGR